MKMKAWISCLVCLTIGFILASLPQSRLRGQDDAVNEGRVKWEYIIASNLDAKALNELGKEGWSLASVVMNPTSGATKCYLQRASLRDADR